MKTSPFGGEDMEDTTPGEAIPQQTGLQHERMGTGFRWPDEVVELAFQVLSLIHI